MLDRKRGRRSRPHGARAARHGRGPRGRVLLTGAITVLAVVLGLMGAMGAFASGGAPKAETERAEEIAKTSATITGSVDPNGLTTECHFEIGTAKGTYTKSVPCTLAPGNRPIEVPEELHLSSLNETTTYYFRIVAKNGDGEAFGKEREFTTLPDKPHANLEQSLEVKRTSAKLRGYVTPDDAEVTNCHFLYGTVEEGPANEVPCTPAKIPAGGVPSQPVEVIAHIEGLMPETRYYVRLYATNEVGTDKGGPNHFNTLPSAPNTGHETARFITHSSAKLSGNVSPNDSKVTECYFEWGVAGSESLPNKLHCSSLPKGEGEGTEEVSAELEGLAEHTTYQYRLVAVNGKGPGGENSIPNKFTTRPGAPVVKLHHAVNVTNETAELFASVDPEGGQITECYFEYGTTPALGGVAACTPMPGASEAFEKVHAKITGLTPGTQYLVRIEAVNAGGEARGGEGEKHNFITSTGGKAPVIKKVNPHKGSPAGGNEVTITGKQFEHIVGVYFGATEAEIVQEGTEKLEVVAPPGVGKVEVTVLTEFGTSEGKTYEYGKPQLTSLSPDEGPLGGGTEVTVTGAGFEVGEHGTAFEFGKATATQVDCTSTTSCVVIAPEAAKAKKDEEKNKDEVPNVEANVNGQHSNKLKFTYKP